MWRAPDGLLCHDAKVSSSTALFLALRLKGSCRIPPAGRTFYPNAPAPDSSTRCGSVSASSLGVSIRRCGRGGDTRRDLAITATDSSAGTRSRQRFALSGAMLRSRFRAANRQPRTANGTWKHSGQTGQMLPVYLEEISSTLASHAYKQWRGQPTSAGLASGVTVGADTALIMSSISGPSRATETGPTRRRLCQADPPGYARPRGTDSAFASIVIRLGHDAEVAGFGASRRRSVICPDWR